MSASPSARTTPSGEPVDSTALSRQVVGALIDAGSVRIAVTNDDQVLDVDVTFAQGRTAIRMPNPIDPTSDLLIVDNVVYLGGGQGKTTWSSFPVTSTEPSVADLARFAQFISTAATTDGIGDLISRGSIGKVASVNGLTTYDIVYPGEGGAKVVVDDAARLQVLEMTGGAPLQGVFTDYGSVSPILAPPADQVTPLIP